MTDRLFTDCCYGTDQQHTEQQPCPQDSETDVAELGKRCADSITPELFEPAVRKVADELYSTLMESVQDWLCDNVEYNIASRIASAEGEARRLRTALWDLDNLLGMAGRGCSRLDRVRDLTRAETSHNELLYAVACKHADETRHQTALRYIRERENAQGMSPGTAKTPQAVEGEAGQPGPDRDAP